MYHRVLIPEQDQQVHRYLWRNMETNRARCLCKDGADVWRQARTCYGTEHFEKNHGSSKEFVSRGCPGIEEQ